MSRSPTLDRKFADLQASFTSLRQRCSKLAVAMLSDEQGVSERAYHELQCLFAEIGRMPDMPYVESIDGRVYAPAEEMLK